MRSLLFVPGDSERKIAKAVSSGADALILDLEDSVAAAAKPYARHLVAEALASDAGGPLRYVRVNGLATGLARADLEAVMVAAPHGIMLPKAEGAADILALSSMIAALEPEARRGTTHILAIATETARALFRMASYEGAGPRLEGIAWGAEDLGADIGAEANRLPDGRHTEPFRFARTVCLFAAAAAGAEPIDGIYPDFRDEQGLMRECEEARRDGFTAKMAIHPTQVPIINEALTPSASVIARAERIVGAFAESGNAGVVGLEGEMLDRPHLLRAERLLARVKGHRH